MSLLSWKLNKATMDLIKIEGYSKNIYTRTLNFEDQAAIGLYLVIMTSISGCWFLNRFLIYETLDV